MKNMEMYQLDQRSQERDREIDEVDQREMRLIREREKERKRMEND